MKANKGILCIYCKYVKRFLDIFFSVILMIFLSPLMLIISLAIVLETRGGAIFKQNRMGRNKQKDRIGPPQDLFLHREIRHSAGSGRIPPAKTEIATVWFFLSKTAITAT